MSLQDIQDNNYSLSASLYQNTNVKYSSFKKLSDFVINLQKGTEPGSKFYCDERTYKFIRTSDIQENSFLFNERLCVGILFTGFKNQNLKKEQILLVKDASLGKVAILEKDYPNCMICGGIHALTCKSPYYVFAILQHPLFRENFERNVPKGSVFSHASEKYLDFDIPLPKDNNLNVIYFIENLMFSIINKEILIKKRFNQINELISNELNFKGFDEISSQEFPKFNEVTKQNKLYAGSYTKRIKFIKNLINSYENGCFFIDKDNFKSGSTPSKKIISSKSSSLKFKWIQPTNINEIGLFSSIPSIDFKNKKNNINSNACLIINRTSKKIDGISGKFVGISTFYDYSFFGKGHHNQGIYRIDNFNDIDLIVIVSLLNHPLYREYMGEISLGSKMKEIKIDDLTSIPFPKFNSSFKLKIKNLFYNKNYYNTENLNNENFLIYDKQWSEKAGLYDLFITYQKQKNLLNNIIEKIYNGEYVEINYNF